MNTKRGLHWARLLVLILLTALLFGVTAKAGSFLVVDSPGPSDVILVLAGETNHRPQRALELLARGFGRRVVLDVPTNAKIYEFPQIQLAEKFVEDLPAPASVSICPIDGLSTKEEAQDVQGCLIRGEERILIVTSDFHTRRALDVFRREIPGHTYSAAASQDVEQFGVRWWSHRQWAKTFVDEWLRLIWWKAIDQW